MTACGAIFWRSWALVLLLFFAPRPCFADVDCPNGNSVPDAYSQWCAENYFVVYHAEGTREPDIRLKKAMPFGAERDSKIRSFALVVANTKYDYWDATHKSLPAVETDLKKIINFLDNQGYDEVLLLKNDDANYDSIRVALDYFNSKTINYANRSRFVFVYDGHGRPSNAVGEGAGIALNKITGAGDSDIHHVFTFEELHAKLKSIAGYAFHTMAIVGSCYSGNLFTSQANRNYVFQDPTHHGAQAVTSADKKSVAWMMQKPEDGTAFFNAFFKILENFGALEPQDPLAQLAGSDRYLTLNDIATFQNVVLKTDSLLLQMLNPDTKSHYPGVLFGDVAPDAEGFDGGPFFLLNPARIIEVERERQASAVPQPTTQNEQNTAKSGESPDAKPVTFGPELGSSNGSKAGFSFPHNNGSETFSALIAVGSFLAGIASLAIWQMLSKRGSASALPGLVVISLAIAAILAIAMAVLTFRPAAPPPTITDGAPDTQEEDGGRIIRNINRDLTHGRPLDKAFNSSGTARPAVLASAEATFEVANPRDKSTGSGIVGDASVAVFDDPRFYAIRGADFSRHNKNIDFNILKNGDGLRFVYLKATDGGKVVDRTFALRFPLARQAGLDVGAYHTFWACQDIDKQLENLRRTVPPDGKFMPIAIDLEWGAPHFFGYQTNGPACKTNEEVIESTYNFAKKVQDIYNKQPVIFIPAPWAKQLLASKLSEFPLWLASSGPSKIGGGKSGGRPWTFWQFSSRGRLRGASDRADVEVFFGNDEQFASFVGSGRDVAMEAVKAP